MRFWLLAVWLVVLPLVDAAQERKKLKPAELEMVEFRARRSAEMIHIDGKVKNVGDQTARGVVLIFYFLAPGGVNLTTKKGPLEVDDVEPGEIAEFLLETPHPPRSVRVRVEAEDRSVRDIKLQNGGPHPIE
jgi:hypothetical protein